MKVARREFVLVAVLITLAKSAEPESEFRKEFFHNLRDPAYLKGSDKNECVSEKTDAPHICINFKKASEDGINGQINLELYSSYFYMAMSTYFHRADVALHGVADFFRAASDEEREHAFNFIDYQNKRGGKVEFYPIKVPHKLKWADTLEAMVDALDLEKRVNKALLKLHQISAKTADPQLLDFIESQYLAEQTEAIKKFGDFVKQLTRLHLNDPAIGEHIFDKELKNASLHC